VDNLTYTLVKFIRPESGDLGRIRTNSRMAKSYSKLSLAMH